MRSDLILRLLGLFSFSYPNLLLIALVPCHFGFPPGAGFLAYSPKPYTLHPKPYTLNPISCRWFPSDAPPPLVCSPAMRGEYEEGAAEMQGRTDFTPSRPAGGTGVGAGGQQQQQQQPVGGAPFHHMQQQQGSGGGAQNMQQGPGVGAHNLMGGMMPPHPVGGGGVGMGGGMAAGGEGAGPGVAQSLINEALKGNLANLTPQQQHAVMQQMMMVQRQQQQEFINRVCVVDSSLMKGLGFRV
jgi:hypothetical protein